MSAVYELGPFRLDPHARVLTRDGVPVALGARAVAVLAALVEHAGAFVTKDAILDIAWPGLVVEENNLAVQISAIRRVLTDAPGGDRWIETLPRRGYRFVGPASRRSDREAQGDAAIRSNVPEARTSFIGRERELVEVKRLLARTRLLTLTGPGGTGKTRLALQVASEVVDAYRDGVRFVDLAPIVNPALVPNAIVHAIGLHEEPGEPPAQAIVDHVAARELLIVIDNCEHVLDASASLVDMLLRVAGPTIVTTSREPLRVPGEQTYPVPALSLPESADDVTSIERSEAVQLFVDRARAHQPDFELTAARAPAVARLCVALDGIPLALELAAARVHVLPIDEINRRLNDRFRLLNLGPRTASPRQQTLRGALDWSHDLLTDEQRIVFRRLGIFAGSFALDVAAIVVSDDVADTEHSSEIVAQLVERSMVALNTGGPDARYRLLETMRAYAIEKLRGAGEADAIASRLARELCERFDRAPPAWLTLPDDAWRRAFLPEVDNVRVALHWALADANDAALGIALAAASAPLWAMLSVQAEGRKWLEAAAECIDADTPTDVQAKLWLWLGLMRAMQVPAESIFAFERAAELYRALDDTAGLGYALLRLGGRLARIGRVADAEPVLAQAYPLLERIGAPKLLADYHATYGFMRSQAHEFASARDAYERSLVYFRGAGSAEHTLNILGNLAEVAFAQGDLDAAERGYREAIAMERDIPLMEERLRGVHLTSLAGILTERGELDAALAVAREGFPMLERAGCPWYNLDHLALRAALAGKLDNAARIAGFQDATLAAKATMRQTTELRARERLESLLADHFSPAQLHGLLAEGARLSTGDLCRIVLEE